MPTPPHIRRTTRTTRNSRTTSVTAVAAIAALSGAGLIALGAAPTAVADEPAPALVLGDIAPIDGVKPGSSFDPPVTVSNKGTEAADKVWVYYSVTRGLDYAAIPSNCQAHQVPSYDEMTEKSNVVCEFDQSVAPGGVGYVPEKPLSIKALDRALHDDLRVSVSDTHPELDENATTPVAGTAPPVKLVERQGGGKATESAVDVPVTSVNTADYQVTGAKLAGRVGDTVALKVKFTNAGPAWVLTGYEDPLVSVLVTPPAGTSVVKANGYCEPKGKAYACGVSQRWIDEGKGETYTFQLKIDKQVAGAKGSVALSDEARPFDPDKANDKAAITLDVTGGGGASGSSGSGGSSGSSGGSGGSTGGSGGSTGGSGGSSGTGGSDGGSSATGGSGSSSAGGAGSSTTGGDLATTGTSSSTLPIAAAAGAAVVAGAGILFVVRRRAQNRD
ncbi:LAETG motif-containing sortase-dependent surface protein [Streptomyces sp. NBC_01506]|uniref:LAETG motif-containing sortase-dependent surface protein n=1 Tax=Streptomyces sp. NBC_01506 TaxID=2903887 RepID=UPI00386BD7E9